MDGGRMSQGSMEYQRRRIRKVGFYGCRQKVVRLERPEGNYSYPPMIRISCTACGHEHVVKPFWRKYLEDRDAGKVAVII